MLLSVLKKRLPESFPSAQIRPSTVPITMETTVSPSVILIPWRIESCVKYCATTPHSKFGFFEQIQRKYRMIAVTAA